LIGVIPKSHQMPVVEEFFELFKTPWELHRPGHPYDVVIATVDELPEIKARLLIIYGATAKRVDGSLGITPSKRHGRGVLSDRDTLVPIYSELLTFVEGSHEVCCVTENSAIAGLRVGSTGPTVLRLGYDLFEEVQFLLSAGQPIEYAHIPTLEIQIGMLRNWILSEGIPILEIPPVPAGHSFVVCLTHDIDFVGIRNHKFDHTMWGFVYRATVGSLRKLFKGRISIGRFFENCRAVASLPLVHAGWARDFWEPFGWYLQVEKGLPATYFLIPFKGCAGEKVPGPHASRRAAAYDVDDLSRWTQTLKSEGCELGVHGIDAWHSPEKGRAERARIAEISGESDIGVRMHWLLRDAKTESVLESSGYTYDSTVGYNETIGYRAGTGQVYRPLGAQKLLEIPVHIQDGALFYPQRLDLPEPEAEKRCRALIEHACKLGGGLTVIWHDRSHGPERFWGDFYVRFIQWLKASDPWFATAGQMVGWFRKRREVRFEAEEAQIGMRIVLRCNGEEVQPPVRLRVYQPRCRGQAAESVSDQTTEFTDISWNGKSSRELESQIASRLAATLPDLTLCSFS
jgi:hypothetical protein